MKHFTKDELLTLALASMSVAELDEAIEQLFEEYKHLTAKLHLAEKKSEDDRELQGLVGAKLLEASQLANQRAGQLKYQTSLPSVEECFDPANETFLAKEAPLDPADKAKADAQHDAALHRKESELNDETKFPPADQPKGKETITDIPYEETAQEAPGKSNGTTTLEQAGEVVDQEMKERSEQSIKNQAETKKKRGSLTDAQVDEIRKALKAGKTPKELGDTYGVHPSTISDIKRGAGRYAKYGAVVTDQEAVAAATVSPAPEQAPQ